MYFGFIILAVFSLIFILFPHAFITKEAAENATEKKVRDFVTWSRGVGFVLLVFLLLMILGHWLRS
jgi:hypothetical protein